MLDFASKHIAKDFDFLITALNTDESKFNISGCYGHEKFSRRNLQTQNLIPTIIHNGGSVMICRSMTVAEVNNLVFIHHRMNQFRYLTHYLLILFISTTHFKLSSHRECY